MSKRADRARKRKQRREPPELNLVVFMNLMIILVPFLLVLMVFSRITSLELNLPAEAAQNEEQEEPEEPQLALEVVVRSDAIEIADRNAGLIARVERSDDGYDFSSLRAKLEEIHGQFPEVETATILLEPDIPYDTLIQVMDHVRITEVDKNGRSVKRSLFPSIAIGSAPVEEPQEGNDS